MTVTGVPRPTVTLTTACRTGSYVSIMLISSYACSRSAPRNSVVRRRTLLSVRYVISFAPSAVTGPGGNSATLKWTTPRPSNR
jgi:hypothetical protein